MKKACFLHEDFELGEMKSDKASGTSNNQKAEVFAGVNRLCSSYFILISLARNLAYNLYFKNPTSSDMYN